MRSAIGARRSPDAVHARPTLLRSILLAAVALATMGAVLIGAGATARGQGNPGPTRPSNVRVTLNSNSAVGLAWTPSADNTGVIGYKVFRNGNEVGRNPTNKVARFQSVGDLSHCGQQFQARQARVAQVMDRTPGLILLAGDTVQVNGTAAEFQCFNASFGRFKNRIWAVPGNHEYNTANAAPFYNYFGNRSGQPGQGWFGINWGAWKVIGLNTNCEQIGDCGVGTAQYKWLKAELEASTAACTAIVTHHPRWSNVNANNAEYLQPMYDLAYDAGVELWLSGDNQFYERYPKLGPDGEPNAKGISQVIAGTGGYRKSLYGPFISQGPDPIVRHRGSFGVAAFTAFPRSYAMRFEAEGPSRFEDSTNDSCHAPNASVVRFRDRGLSAGATHTYQVQAYDSAGKVGPKSSPVTVTVGSSGSSAAPPPRPTAQPVGEFEVANMVGNRIVTTGWALDPDTSASIRVVAFVDGKRAKAGPALTSRPDIGAAYGKGNNHGFYLRVPATKAIHRVCLWALNDAGGPHTRLACKRTSAKPVGALFGVAAKPGKVTVAGWAIDPDTRGQIKIVAFANGFPIGVFNTGTASPHTAVSYPGYSAKHGYIRRFNLPAGRHRVCVLAVNNTPDGAPKQLGCRNVTT